MRDRWRPAVAMAQCADVCSGGLSRSGPGRLRLSPPGRRGAGMALHGTETVDSVSLRPIQSHCARSSLAVPDPVSVLDPVCLCWVHSVCPRSRLAVLAPVCLCSLQSVCARSSLCACEGLGEQARPPTASSRDAVSPPTPTPLVPR